jgi:hypothetical protein
MAGLRPIQSFASLIDSEAYETGFAVMKANYVDRPAPYLPGGRIKGLEPPARDIAVLLRDSISARFNSLLVHHDLLARTRDNQRRTLETLSDMNSQTQFILKTTWQSHFFFDDIVFNAASLFDYIANAVWFGHHGLNHRKKKWNKAYDAAKSSAFEQRLPRGARIFGSAAGNLILEAHESLVDDLYGYRSELIHHNVDGPNIFSHTFWAEASRSDAELALPRLFLKRLSHVLTSPGDEQAEVNMVHGAERLIVRIGETVVPLLQALRDDLGYDKSTPLTMLS